MNEELEEQDDILAEAPLPKLTAQELDAFSLKCAVCGEEIDPERARKRKRTCSDAHTRVYNQYRRHLWSQTRCASCYRPSTPEERKDFRAWRAERGDVLRSIKLGRPKKTREKALELAIRAVVDELGADQKRSMDAQQLEEKRAWAIKQLTSVISPEVAS